MYSLNCNRLLRTASTLACRAAKSVGEKRVLVFLTLPLGVRLAACRASACHHKPPRGRLLQRAPISGPKVADARWPPFRPAPSHARHGPLFHLQLRIPSELIAHSYHSLTAIGYPR